MGPTALKTTGYLVSCVSVVLLAVAAWPGAEKAGLIPALVAGAGASIVGMGLRWLSYRVERRRRQLHELAGEFSIQGDKLSRKVL